MEHMTDAQQRGFMEIFARFDRKREGRIDAKELGTILRALGQNPTPAEVQDIIAEVDADGTGKMDMAEFLNMMAGSLRDTDETAEVEAAFEAFDKDADGLISVADLRAAAKELGHDLSSTDLQEMVQEADQDGDGQISLASFKKLMSSN